MTRRRPLFDRLVEACEWYGDCLVYTRSRLPKGYGLIGAGGRGGKQLLTHRASWELHNGPIPAGLVVRHKVCDNPPCINPEHLDIGTHRDNNYDMWEQGSNSRHSPLKKFCINRHPRSDETTNAAGCRECQRERKSRRVVCGECQSEVNYSYLHRHFRVKHPSLTPIYLKDSQ